MDASNRTSSPVGEAQEPHSQSWTRQYEFCEPWFECEGVEDYAPGGLHPIVLGDVLGDNGCFEIVQKLGYGGFATVWLCYDTRKSKWRAVKVLRAEISKEDCPELKMMARMAGLDFERRGGGYVCLPLEHFWQEGPNGRHLCLVMPLMGPTLDSIFDDIAQDAETVKNFCFQMAEGMRFLHQNGICHGDFRPKNILVQSTGVEDLGRDELLGLMAEAEPMWEPVHRREGEGPGAHGPEYLVESNSIMLDKQFLTKKIAIIDFGVAYEIHDPPTWTGINLDYSAPEVFLEMELPLGVPTDIWALGASISVVRSAWMPFESACVTNITSNLEDMYGPLPETLVKAWRKLGGTPYGGEVVVPDGVDPSTVPHTVSLGVLEGRRKEREGSGYTDFLEWRIGRAQEHSIRVSKESMEDSEEEIGQAGTDSGFDDSEAADEEPKKSSSAMNAAAEAAPDATIEEDRMEADETSDVDLTEAAAANEDEEDFEDIDIKIQLSKEEVKVLSDLLRSTLRCMPEDRASIDDVLNHPWFGDRNAEYKAQTGNTGEQGVARPKESSEPQDMGSIPARSETGIGLDADMPDAPEPRRQQTFGQAFAKAIARLLWPIGLC